MGVFKFFLGMKVNDFTDCLHISQQKYTQDLLESFGLMESKPFSIPMSSGAILAKFDGYVLADATAYGKLDGSLQYLTMTRPYISFTINKLCEFMASPTDSHWFSLKWLLRHLKGTI